MKANIQPPMLHERKARVFFALWPSPEARCQLHSLALQCQKTCDGRAMAAQTLHLTLLFVGEVARTRIVELGQAMHGLEFEPFSFRLQRIAYWRHNRIVYAAPKEHSNELHNLAVTLRRRVAAIGGEFDERPFSPHVTLLRKVERPLQARAIPSLEWRVEAFSLVESGAQYRSLQTWQCRK